jgi:tetratricopeptide (TPR) repeat protein
MRHRAGLLVLAGLLFLSSAALAGELGAPGPPRSELKAVERAQTLLGEGRPREAEAALAGTTSLAAQLERGQALAWQGKPAEAAELLRKVANATGQQLDPHATIGWVFLAAGWKASPEALAHHARGLWLAQRDRCQEARTELEEALRLAPELADARSHLGYCLEKLGDQQGFERELRAAIAGYTPGDRVLRASAEYSLGNWLAHSGPLHAQEAIALLRSAVSPEGLGRLPGVLLALGQAETANGEVSASQATFAELLERLERGEGPQFPATISSSLAWKLYTSGCRRRPADAPPGQPPACASEAAQEQLRKGYEAMNSGEVAGAEAPLREATRLEPTLGAAWAGLGASYLSQKRPLEAVPAYENAVANRGYRDARGWAEDHLGLAQALIQSGGKGPEAWRASGEAARILEAETSRRESSVVRRADLEVAIGRAFMLAGNPRCAAQRFEWVERRADAPEQLRKFAREMLTLVRPPGAPGDGHCFEYELYRPTTLQAEAARYLKKHPRGNLGNPTAVQTSHPPERYQSRVRFTGRFRPLSPERVKQVNDFYRGWELTHRIPDLPGGAARQEVEVEEAGSLRWVPIQEAMVAPLKAERGEGGLIDLFVMLLGDLDGDPIFIAGGFHR